MEAVDANHSLVRMYFDTHTGLLIRRDARLRVRSLVLQPDGSTKSRFLFADSEIYFDDYRNVEGVKEPFLRNINIGSAGSQSRKTTERYFEIKNNIPIDDSKFNLP